MTQSYNNSIHRSISMTPNEAMKTSDAKLFDARYYKKKFDMLPNKQAKYKFDIGDTVRILRSSYPFEREYSEKFTHEYFIVTHRYMNQNVPIYVLSDSLGEPIQGHFYGFELLKIIVEPNKEYKIEKIMGRKRIDGVKHVLVKWQHWPEKFNSYVKESEVQNYKASGNK